jgi:hypothetical protein
MQVLGRCQVSVRQMISAASTAKAGGAAGGLQPRVHEQQRSITYFKQSFHPPFCLSCAARGGTAGARCARMPLLLWLQITNGLPMPSTCCTSVSSAGELLAADQHKRRDRCHGLKRSQGRSRIQQTLRSTHTGVSPLAALQCAAPALASTSGTMQDGVTQCTSWSSPERRIMSEH